MASAGGHRTSRKRSRQSPARMSTQTSYGGEIDLLRESFNVPYPLADQRPYVSGRELVLQAQQVSQQPGELWLVTVAGGQLLLTSPSESFLLRARWEGDVATGWRPHDEGSAVLIDPSVRFGRPAVSGISTEVIWEHSEDGEDDDEIAAASA